MGRSFTSTAWHLTSLVKLNHVSFGSKEHVNKLKKQTDLLSLFMNSNEECNIAHAL